MIQKLMYEQQFDHYVVLVRMHNDTGSVSLQIVQFIIMDEWILLIPVIIHNVNFNRSSLCRHRYIITGFF